MLTGLSIATLRYYDDIGLLRPAEIEPRTSYRRYSYAQIDVARRIRRLREAELPTEQIDRVLRGDGGDAREVLLQQRAQLRERTGRVQAVLDQLMRELQHDVEGTPARMKSAADFRLVAVNTGVESEVALEAACAFWGEVPRNSLITDPMGNRVVLWESSR